MIHGDRYFEKGGLSYQFYTGVSQEAELEDERVVINRAKAVGGKLVLHLPSRRFFDTFDIGYQRLLEISHVEREHLNGVELLIEKRRMRFLAEIARASVQPFGSMPHHFRQGYYLQPSLRTTNKVFAVAQYDRLHRHGESSEDNALARQSAGLTYRPQPVLSLKFEVDR